ncbi:MAG TPA: hypothetical protein VLL69_07675 [Streptosporangiaceae bacterium]|nr:hypothetical protein [Streptosporangiaceae bacterium]
MADVEHGPGEAQQAAGDAVPEEAAGEAMPEQAADLAAEDAVVAQIADLAAEDAIVERAAELATEVTEADKAADRRRLTASLAAAAHSGARATGRGVRAARRGMGSARRGMGSGGGRLATQVVAMAQRLRIRDQAALRAQFPGKSSEEIAEALIEGAARASAAVGGAVGAWAALPVLPAYPVEIATETLALIGIEIKLVAELHEAYGTPAAGTRVERMTAYVAAWAHRRGVFMVPTGLVLAAGSPLARRLRWRLATRMSRSVFSLGPLLTGAFAGAMLNRQETRRLGHSVRADLRRQVQQGGGTG